MKPRVYRSVSCSEMTTKDYEEYQAAVWNRYLFTTDVFEWSVEESAAPMWVLRGEDE